MDAVRIDKDKLLAIVKGNLEQHKIDIEDAKGARLVQYELDVRAALDNLESLKDIGVPSIPNNTEEYERIIRMLELCADDSVELETHQFDNYVMDRWHSTQMLKGMLNTYSVSGALR